MSPRLRTARGQHNRLWLHRLHEVIHATPRCKLHPEAPRPFLPSARSPWSPCSTGRGWRLERVIWLNLEVCAVTGEQFLSSGDNCCKCQSSSWAAVKWFKGSDPGPAWHCCYLVISPDTSPVFPLPERERERGVLNPPSICFPPQRDYARNAENPTDPRVSRMAPGAPVRSRSGNSRATWNWTPGDHPAVGKLSRTKIHSRKPLQPRRESAVGSPWNSLETVYWIKHKSEFVSWRLRLGTIS